MTTHSQTTSTTTTVTTVCRPFDWTWPVNMTVPFSEIVAKLQAAGLDDTKARTMYTSHAFRRAVRAIVPDTLKDLIHEDGDKLSFQISGRVKAQDGVSYVTEAVVHCSKATGVITSQCPVTQQLAKDAFDLAMGTRHASDCTRLMQRLIAPQMGATIFRKTGRGSYLALAAAFPFFARLEAFVVSLGGSMTYWNIEERTNLVQIQSIVCDTFDLAFTDADKHIDTITSESRSDVVARAHASLEEIEADLKNNARLIGDQLGRLEDYLALAKKKLGLQMVTPPAPVAPVAAPVAAPAAEDEVIEAEDAEDDDAVEAEFVVPASGPVEIITGKASDLVHNPDPFLMPAPLA